MSALHVLAAGPEKMAACALQLLNVRSITLNSRDKTCYLGVGESISCIVQSLLHSETCAMAFFFTL